MRTPEHLPAGTIVNEDLTKFPNKGILNETPTQKGTPVVEELIGDVLENLYALLRDRKINPTGDQDNATTQYQILKALKLLTNELNDSEQVLSLTGSIFSVPLDISLFPDKYFLFAKASENYISTTSYSFKGTGDTVLPFSSNGFSVNDELLIIIDVTGVRAYSLSSSVVQNDVFTPFGTPLSFNDSDSVWYQSKNIVFNDKPESFNLDIPVTALFGVSCVVNEVIIYKGIMLCLVFNTITDTYSFVKLNLSDFSEAFEVSMVGLDFPAGVDNKPYIYSDGVSVYVSNNCGNSADDFSLASFTSDASVNTLTFSGSIDLDGFDKSTNIAIKSGYMYSLIENVLNQHNLLTGEKIVGNSFTSFLGILFSFNKNIYYTNGEVAKKWNLPIFT